MAHKTGFTARTLAAHGQAAGFASLAIRRREKKFDLWMIATKMSVSNERLRDLLGLYARA
jgi:hypothetical protein